jgi:hypothetical protein
MIPPEAGSSGDTAELGGGAESVPAVAHDDGMELIFDFAAVVTALLMVVTGCFAIFSDL